MDRLISDYSAALTSSTTDPDPDLSPALALPLADEALVQTALQRLAIPKALYQLSELESFYDGDARALWTYMRPTGRPSFTPAMLGDFECWQSIIGAHFGPTAHGKAKVSLDFLVLGSRSPGVFCFGGDLELFQNLIRVGDRDALAAYGHRCVTILHRNIGALDLPILTIGLVAGQALGGGFEALLSFDMIIAERGSSFGLPEVAFGLFPGMGAHALLTRRLGSAIADRIIVSGQTYTAEEMYDLGIVSQLAAPGEGQATARAYIAKNARRVGGLIAARRAARLASPVGLAELCAIVDIWADAAVALSEADLRLMSRLAAVQTRRHAA